MTQASTLHERRSTASQVNTELRMLALKADGLTGADIERLVREARQTARRQNRPVTWQDLDQAMRQETPVRTPVERWLRAVHEAGHAVLNYALAFGDPIRLSIEGGTGAAFYFQRDRPMLYEDDYETRLAIRLAGRAAEKLIFGVISTGSAGAEHSDLGQATELAIGLESILGFSEHKPLLYRTLSNALGVDDEDSAFAARVNQRLERAYEIATYGINLNRPLHQALAEAVYQHGILEGHQVTALIGKVIAEQHQQEEAPQNRRAQEHP